MDTPDLDQLGRIASTVKRQYWPDGSMPCGITHEELLAEGWLAYTSAKRFPYARARFAMIDLIRNVMAPVSGRMSQIKNMKAVSLDEPIEGRRNQYGPHRFLRLVDQLVHMESESHKSPVRSFGLSKGNINALRTFCHRFLSQREARIVIETLIGGESIEMIADQMGITRERAVVTRSQAIGKIRSYLNN